MQSNSGCFLNSRGHVPKIINEAWSSGELIDHQEEITGHAVRRTQVTVFEHDILLV